MKNKLKLVKELIRSQVTKILTESKSVKELKSDYDKAIKKEQALSSLMLMNLVKYKQAKSSGDEKAVAKFTKIAGQLSPKKKKASELANKAYQAYEDMISGMHADVELEIDEGRLTEAPMDKRFAKEWEKNCKVLLTHIDHEIKKKDRENYRALSKLRNYVMDASSVPEQLATIVGMQEGKLTEAKMTKSHAKILSRLLIRMNVESVIPHKDVLFVNYTNYRDRKKIVKAASKLYSYDDDGRMTNAPRGIQGVGGTNWIAFKSRHNESVNEAEDYKYKKYAAKAFDKINDAMFEFRHSMGIKTLTNKDQKLKRKVENLAMVIFDLQKEMKSKGLTEASRKDLGMSSSVNKRRAGAELKQKLAGKRSDGMGKYTATIYGMNGSKRVELKSLNDLNKFSKFELDEGKLNEMDMNDPILVAIRARKTMLAKEKSAPKVKKISTKQYYKLMDMEIDLINQKKDATKEFDQMNSDMLQDAGQKGEAWSDADANKWGGDLDKLQTKVEKLAKDKLKVKKAIMTYRIN